MNTAAAADAFRIKHNLPAGEEPVATFARALINANGNVVQEPDDLTDTFGAPAAVPSGDSYLLPAARQSVFYGPITIAGQLSIAGEARFGPWPF